MGMFAAALPIAGTVASTGLAIYSQRYQTAAMKAAAQYNTRLAEAEAANQEAETREGITRARSSQRAALADIRARIAGSGVQTTTGNAALIPAEAAGRFELSIADHARSAAMQAASLRMKGRMGLWEADQMAKASKLQSLATGIQGLTSAWGQYSQAKYTGTL